jgi:hypothetical protein
MNELQLCQSLGNYANPVCTVMWHSQVFRSWHFKKMEERRRKRDEAEEDRKKKGMLSGREIFMQDGFQAQVRAWVHECVGASETVRDPA